MDGKQSLANQLNGKVLIILQILQRKKLYSLKIIYFKKGHEGSAVKNIVGTLNGFWNWLMENDLTKVSVWNGLKKRLPDAD